MGLFDPKLVEIRHPILHRTSLTWRDDMAYAHDPMASESTPNRRQGRRFQPYFVAECINLRKGAGRGEEAVAEQVGRRASAIIRFETGETWPAENLETYAAAYAAIAQPPIDDPRNIYERALRSWISHGKKPLTAPELAQLKDDESELSFRDLVESIRRAGEIERARGEAGQQSTSTRKRRATQG